MKDLENPNLFQPDGSTNVYDVDYRNRVQMRCPHCQCVGTFEPAINQYLGYSKTNKNSSKTRFDGFEAHILMCPSPSCRSLVFALCRFSGDETDITSFPPELMDFNAENLPPFMIRTLKEALVCHSQGAFRASAMMVRRLLEELCHDCGVEGPTLHARLRELRNQITLPEDLFDAMDELKALGNDAAHIEAKAFSTIDKEESQLSIELAQEILKARYQHKSLVDRLRKRKLVNQP